MSKPVLINLEPNGYSQEAQRILEQHYNYVPSSKVDAKAHTIITRLGHYIGADVLKQAPDIKYVATATTGLDHLDQKLLDKHGVQVVSLKGETDFLDSITATAELTWLLVLATQRPVFSAQDDVHAGNWNRDAFVGQQLAGKTLGIIGMGRLGKIVADYAKAFRMNVLAYSNPEPGQTISSLKEVLNKSDIISLHLPLNEQTKGFFNEDLIAQTKPGVSIVNTARGEVVDEGAILEGLHSGQISVYAADVLTGEAQKDRKFLKNNKLWQYSKKNPRVILTPHIGGACRDAMEQTEIFIAKKLVSYIKA